MNRIAPAFYRLIFLSWSMAALIFSACSGVVSTSVPTPGVSTPIISTVLSSTGTATPTNTLLPLLGVDPASLAGVTLTVWHAFAGDAYGIFNEQVSLFNATNEWDISITHTGYGDYLTLFDALQAAPGEDGLPGIVITLPEQGLAWQGKDSVVQLDPYLHDPEFGLTVAEMADFPPVFWTGPGAPAQRSARFLFYNQSWAHELGFTSAPQTLEQFRQQAYAANAAFKSNPDPVDDGFGGWVVDDNWQTIYAWIRAFGGNPVDGETYQLDADESMETLSYLKGLYDDNCAWLSTDEAPYEAFALRKALFVSGDLAEIKNVRLLMAEWENPDDWSLIPYPGVDDPVVVANGPSYFLLQATTEQQLAGWLFIRWMLSTENQAQWVEATGLLPLRFSVLEMIAPYRSASPQWVSAVNALDMVQAAPGLDSWRKVRYLLSDGVKHLFQVNLPLAEIPGLLEQMQTMALELADE